MRRLTATRCAGRSSRAASPLRASGHAARATLRVGRSGKTAWAWGCRSRAPSWRRTAGASGASPIPAAGRSSASPCRACRTRMSPMPSDQTVHVIDDDDAARDSLAFLFRTADVDVRTYASATEFLAAAPSLTGGCVVTDVRMPQMDGLELLRRLRALDLALPVIVMTGHGDIPLAVEAMKAGAIDFF